MCQRHRAAKHCRLRIRRLTVSRQQVSEPSPWNRTYTSRCIRLPTIHPLQLFMDFVIAVSTHYKRFSFLLVHNRSPFCINIKVAHTLYLIHLNRWHICAAHFADIRLIPEKQFFRLVHLLVFGDDVCITPKGVLHPLLKPTPAKSSCTCQKRNGWGSC